jgi:hypothetical protein
MSNALTPTDAAGLRLRQSAAAGSPACSASPRSNAACRSFPGRADRRRLARLVDGRDLAAAHPVRQCDRRRQGGDHQRARRRQHRQQHRRFGIDHRRRGRLSQGADAARQPGPAQGGARRLCDPRQSADGRQPRGGRRTPPPGARDRARPLDPGDRRGRRGARPSRHARGSAFVRDHAAPSASVILKLQGGRALGERRSARSSISSPRRCRACSPMP